MTSRPHLPRTILRASLFAPLACGAPDPAADSANDTTGPAATTGDSTTADAPTTTGADPTTGSTGLPDDPPDEAPDYDAAFPQDRVPRLDITIAPADWQRMTADMTDMLGEFGAHMGMGPMMGPPPELVAACEGLAAGDMCVAPFEDQELPGKCGMINGELVCFPEMFPPPGDGMGMEQTGLLPRTPVYVECDVATDDRAWHHVGIRFKGNSSLGMSWGQGIGKLPLRLNFDKFEDDYPETENQRFYGFDSLSLSNGAMDRSLMRDKLGHDVFALAGLPAPTTAFYRVYLDRGEGPVYLGLYTAIELPSDDTFLDTRFGSHDGNLYKPEGGGGRLATFDAATLGKENHEDEADFSDIAALITALNANRSDAAAWRAGLAARLDVDGFLHTLALNTVIQDWDSYGRMPHNYYLYADPQIGGAFRWVAWDHSFAFDPNNAIPLDMSDIGEAWPLIRYLYDDPVHRATYDDYVAEAAADEYHPATWAPRVQAAHDLIAPYVVGPDGEQPGYTFLQSDADFTQALAELLAHVEARQQDVAAYLGG
jgi:hypothetical protein